MLKNVTRVATFTDRMRVLVKTSYGAVREILKDNIWKPVPQPLGRERIELRHNQCSRRGRVQPQGHVLGP